MRGQPLAPGEDWVETSAEVIASVYRYTRFWDIDLADGQDHSRYLITFRYSVDGKLYVSEMEQFEPVEEGTTLSVLYNPNDPDQNSLSLSPRRTLSLTAKVLIVVATVTVLFVLEHHFGWNLSE